MISVSLDNNSGDFITSITAVNNRYGAATFCNNNGTILLFYMMNDISRIGSYLNFKS